MAPEIFLTRQYQPAVDIWALGVVLIEMAEGRPPYHKLDRKEALKAICSKGCALSAPDRQFPCLLYFFLFVFSLGLSFSAEMRDFALRCLDKNAQRRSGAEQLLQHPFVLLADSRTKPTPK